MNYEATITDPTVFTRPWTMRVGQRRMPDDEFWEFACHEGNVDPDLLSNQIDNSNTERNSIAHSAHCPKMSRPLAYEITHLRPSL